MRSQRYRIYLEIVRLKQKWLGMACANHGRIHKGNIIRFWGINMIVILSCGSSLKNLFKQTWINQCSQCYRYESSHDAMTRLTKYKRYRMNRPSQQHSCRLPAICAILLIYWEAEAAFWSTNLRSVCGLNSGPSWGTGLSSHTQDNWSWNTRFLSALVCKLGGGVI